MMRTTKLNKKTPAKKTTKVLAKPINKAKTKVKPKFNLKGVPVKFKMICNLAIEHAETQTQCYELLLVGVKAYEDLLEKETPENTEKMKMQVVTQAMIITKQTFDTDTNPENK